MHLTVKDKQGCHVTVIPMRHNVRPRQLPGKLLFSRGTEASPRANHKLRNHPMKTENMLLTIPLLLVACGAEPDAERISAEIDGTVQGSSLGESPPALVVHRLANTQLSADGERLEFFFGADFMSFCPDILEPVELATTLIFSLNGPTITTGTYPLCDGFECPGNHLSTRFDGWLLPSGETVEPTSGSAEVTEITSDRVTGSFTLDFEGEVVTGEFAIAIDCVDDRPRQ